MVLRARSYRLVLFFLCFAFFVDSASQNITADDEGPNAPGSTITYLPSNASWAQGNKLPNFGGLDISKPWATTWHNASSDASTSTQPSVSIVFTGIAVYIYNVVQRAYQTDLTMTLDGAESGTYQNPLSVIDSPNDTTYWEIVYAVSGLQNTQHTLIVALDDLRNADNPYNLLLFDRAVYTTSDDVATTASDSPTQNLPNITGTDTQSATGGSTSTATISSSSRLATISTLSPDVTSSPNNSSADQKSSSGLGTGGAVAISVGATAFVAVCIGALVFLLRRRHPQDQSGNNHTYSIVPWIASRSAGNLNGPRVNLDESPARIQVSSADTGSGLVSLEPRLDHTETIPTYEEAMDKARQESLHSGD